MELVWGGKDPSKVSAADISQKGKGLLELYAEQQEGLFKVPDFFILPKQFFQEYLKAKDLTALLDIKTFKQANEAYWQNNRGPYINFTAPPSIEETMEEFFTHYQEQLQPAIQNLINLKEYNNAAKKRYDEMEAAARAFEKKTGHHPENLEEHEKAFKKVSSQPMPNFYDNIIIRSASILEQGEQSFDGVFKSWYATSTDHSEIANEIASVLASSWSPYALYCMEQARQTSHEMALIIQAHIQPEYSGRIDLEDDVIIKFNPGPTRDAFTKNIRLERGELIKKASKEDPGIIEEQLAISTEAARRAPLHDDDKERKMKWYWEKEHDIARFENKHAPKIAELQGLFPKNTSLEFLINEDKLYLVQKRNKKRKAYHQLTPPQNAKTITDKLGSQIIMDEVGTAVNLMDYDEESSLESIDKEYPGAIYILNDKGLKTLLDEERTKKFNETTAKELLMRTPNKKAIIFPLSRERWNHLHEVSYDLKFPFVSYDKTATEEKLKAIQTGTKLGLWSDTKKTILYEP